MKRFMKKLTSVFAVMAVMTTMCIPAYAEDYGTNMSLERYGTFTISLPGSVSFDSMNFTANTPVVNMQWTNTADLTQTINISAKEAVTMQLSRCYSGFNTRAKAEAAGLQWLDDSILKDGVMTIYDSYTTNTDNPLKLYCKVSSVKTQSQVTDSQWAPHAPSDDNKARRGNYFGVIQLRDNSSTDYEDVIGGMTISNLYVDEACTIPATAQNTRAGSYSAGLTFAVQFGARN